MNKATQDTTTAPLNAAAQPGAATGASGDLRRVAVLNRGEPAVRFCRALSDYNAERGTHIDSVALYTEPDVDTPFTRLATTAYCLGPALVPGPEGALRSAYLDIDRVLAALEATGCDAVWPGWGFAAEDAAFVAQLEAAGVTFLGPSSQAMERLGDKIAAKVLAEECGVPMAPWWQVPDDASEATIRAEAERIGFPLMIKASAGGGGRGIRKVHDGDALLPGIAAVRDEVRKVFGAGGLLLEACITDARHVEVQLVCGADGKAVALGVRDCSVQRRNQKILEEAPSSVLPEAMARVLCESSERLAELAGYRSAGTAEFLYQPASGTACFLEVNSRLQVEHTVTECVTGVDLVHAQIDVARGLPLSASGTLTAAGTPPATRGWAIEARLCAEDAARNFAPSPGRVTVFRPPSGPGIRVDSGITEGSNIAAEFDSMIAKVIATGANRMQALARLRRALAELQVVVEDGATNKALLLELLERDEVVSGSAHTGWLDGALAARDVGQQRRAFEALCFAAIVAYRRQRQSEMNAFFLAAQGGIPQNPPEPKHIDIELALAGQRVTLQVHALGHGSYLVGPEGERHVAQVSFDGGAAATLTLAGERHDVRYAYGDKGVTVEVDGAMHTVEPAAGGAVKAPAPAMVVQVAVKEGQTVQAGQRLLTLEAMKLEMPLLAPEAGTVKAVLCNANQQVNAGQVLVVVEAVSDAPDAADTAEHESLWQAAQTTPLQRMFGAGEGALRRFDELPEDAARETMADLCAAVRSVLLGYDVSEDFAAAVTRLLGDNLDFERMAHPERWLPAVKLLACFADVQRVFDRTPRTEGSSTVSDHSLFFEACRLHTEGIEGAPEGVRPSLTRALAWYGQPEGGALYREALFRLHLSATHSRRRHALGSLLLRTAIDLQAAGVDVAALPGLAEQLDTIARLADPKQRFVADNALHAEYMLFVQPRYLERLKVVNNRVRQALTDMAIGGAVATAQEDALVASPDAVTGALLPLIRADKRGAAHAMRVLLRRNFGADGFVAGAETVTEGVVRLDFQLDDTPHACALLLAELSPTDTVARAAAVLQAHGEASSDPTPTDLELLIPGAQSGGVDDDALLGAVSTHFGPGTGLQRVTLTWAQGRKGTSVRLRTYRRDPAEPGQGDGAWREDALLRDIHPAYARRFELHRLNGFHLQRIDSPDPVYAFMGVAKDNPRDERIFAFAGVRSVPDAATSAADPTSLWELERAFYEGLRVIRETQSRRDVRKRLHWNRLTLYVREPVAMSYEDICGLSHKLDGAADGLGLEKAVVRCRMWQSSASESAPQGERELKNVAVVIARPGKHRLQVSLHEPTDRPVRAMSDFAMNVVRARRFGLVYPYELIRMLTGERSGTDHALPHPHLRSGTFTEYDLSAPDSLALEPVQRPYGANTAAVVVGTLRNPTDKHPEGITRVLIVNDPTQAMCALAEPECRRVLGALALAKRLQVPVEWVSISAGAKIAMDSGTENLDWTARVLRGLVQYTQDGGVVHVIVAGVNVGAQSYWNAEATMLMHTRGLLIMTADGSCVLTGKKALEVSGSVAAEDERGIGGWERVMGPNGQAQLFARDLGEAYGLLMEHYRFTWTDPKEARPRRRLTSDDPMRDIGASPYVPGGRAPEDAGDFATVGEIFSLETNPGRKRPFDVRAVMRAVIDTDGGQLERFSGMSEGETAVVWDAHLGGFPVCVVGFESRPLRRRGRIPTDGPDTWTGGTLFPQSSKKVARAINAASGNRPVVVLANLSGFDGSPESLRRLQLEYGAEIGRAVVNFDGPIVFVVIGRYHGGAYVVFSKALNPQLSALALKGSYASVIGGGPAAAVVFPREVRARAARDERVLAAKAAMKAAAPADKPRLREQLNKLTAKVTLEMQGQVAEEFDGIHTVERAVEVGSLDAVIAPEELRPAIIARLEAGLAAAQSQMPGVPGFVVA